MFRGLRSQRGQGLVEYGLLIFFISIPVIVALGRVAVHLRAIFDRVGDALGG